MLDPALEAWQGRQSIGGEGLNCDIRHVFGTPAHSVDLMTGLGDRLAHLQGDIARDLLPLRLEVIDPGTDQSNTFRHGCATPVREGISRSLTVRLQLCG